VVAATVKGRATMVGCGGDGDSIYSKAEGSLLAVVFGASNMMKISEW
jgi:hypothetical protein